MDSISSPLPSPSVFPGGFPRLPRSLQPPAFASFSTRLWFLFKEERRKR